MKRAGAALVLLLVLAAGVCAHDKGDVMLNIETQLGVAIPPLEYFGLMKVGPDLGLRTTVDYYFTDWFSLNFGLGFGFNYHHFVEYTMNPAATWWWLFPPAWIILAPAALLTMKESIVGRFFAPYVTVPLGLRLSISAFSMGAGATINIPVHTRIELEDEEGITIDGGYYDRDVVRKGNSYYGVADETTTIRHRMETLFNMGWYADIGFDLSGRQGKKHGFGTLIRLAGSFGDSFTMNPPLKEHGNGPRFLFQNSFFSISLIFQAAIELANVPTRKQRE
jgi:hypothetical protein